MTCSCKAKVSAAAQDDHIGLLAVEFFLKWSLVYLAWDFS